MNDTIMEKAITKVKSFFEKVSFYSNQRDLNTIK